MKNVVFLGVSSELIVTSGFVRTEELLFEVSIYFFVTSKYSKS